MCLETKWKNPKIAEKDIKCWIVAHVKQEGFISLYRRVAIENEMLSLLDDMNIEDKYLLTHTVQIGLHSFAKYSDACKYRKNLRREKLKVMPCIIPKGARYYEGEFESLWCEKPHTKSYASNMRNLVKPITI